MIPDGTYDNRFTHCRVSYRGGKIVRFETAESIAQRRKMPEFSKIPAFGELIDLPVPRKCLSCGAIEVNGAVPCGH